MGKQLISALFGLVLGLVAALSDWVIELASFTFPNTHRVACAWFDRCDVGEWVGWRISKPQTNDAYIIWDPKSKYEICFDAGDGQTQKVKIDNSNDINKQTTKIEILEGSCRIDANIPNGDDTLNIGIFLDPNTNATWARGRYRVVN